MLVKFGLDFLENCLVEGAVFSKWRWVVKFSKNCNRARAPLVLFGGKEYGKSEIRRL